MHLTTGYELTTALTNIIIFATSFFSYIKTKKTKYWKLFFLFMSIDSFLGVIVHGIKMSTSLNNILWIILLINFAITINILLAIFLKYKTRHIIILSMLLIIMLMVHLSLNINFILSFTMYVLLVLILCIYYLFKSNIKNKKYFIIGFIIQIIGGIIMLSKIHLMMLDHNGVYHLFMTLTIIFFYLGVNKK